MAGMRATAPLQAPDDGDLPEDDARAVLTPHIARPSRRNLIARRRPRRSGAAKGAEATQTSCHLPRRWNQLAIFVLVAAAFGLDLLWPVFLLIGLERVRIAPGITAFTPRRARLP